jgi:iron complex transport system ATP-binding protein
MAPASAVSPGTGASLAGTLSHSTFAARIAGTAQAVKTPGEHIDSATAALATAHDATLLTCTDLGLRVGNKSRSRGLIEGLNLTARRGEFWCVLGANGAGKTTLLHTLAGLRAPDGGSLALAGRPMARWSARDAACLRGFLPQGGDALFGLSALQAVLLGRHPHSRSQFGLSWESDEDLAIAHAALERLDLADLAEREVSSLSGGERQRVALAALLAQDPLVYLLDEPLNHLDLRHQLGVMALLRDQALRQGRLVMASVHDASLAARFATHALVIVGPGRCVAGPADEVLTDEVLSAALGHALRRIEVDGQTLVVAM